MSKKRKGSSSSNFVKYMGMPFQLLALLGVSAYLGMQIDNHLKHETKYLTALFSFIALIVFLYKLIKEETKT